MDEWDGSIPEFDSVADRAGTKQKNERESVIWNTVEAYSPAPAPLALPGSWVRSASSGEVI